MRTKNSTKVASGRKMAAKAAPKPKNSKVTVTTVKSVRKARAVTFEITTVKNKRTFRPVNKRAKALASLAGKTSLTVANLKDIKALGFRVLETGSLTPVKL